MTLLSMRQYAKHRGVTVEAVSKAVRRGRITCKRDERGYAQIDPAVADKEWETYSDPAKFRHSGPADTKAETPDEAPKEQNHFQKSAVVLKTYQARLAKLEFDEKSGKLLDADEVKRQAFKTARSVRDALLGIPDRLSAELAGETDQFTVRQKLDAEIRQALETLAGDLAEPVE